MKTKNMHLSINLPHPCSEVWEEMTPTGDGRFCAHCQTTVTDFRNFTDAELFKYFSKQKGNICGRFYADQVNKPIQIPYQPHSRLYRIAVGLGLTLLIVQTQEAKAHARPPFVQTQTNLGDLSLPGGGTAILRGAVSDPNSLKLQGAVVILETNGVVIDSAITDKEGTFKIQGLSAGDYKVTIKHALYNTLENTISLVNGQELERNFIFNPKVWTIASTQNPIYLDPNPRFEIGGAVANPVVWTVDLNAPPHKPHHKKTKKPHPKK